MQKFQNLYLIGTSHISKQSINEIKEAFKEKPDILAVELDRQRAHGLMSNKTGKPTFYDIRRIGFKGFLFALLGGWASKKLGKIVGVTPGSEMKTALILAKKNKVQIQLIDQPIEITLKRFSKTLSWKERWHFIVDLVTAPFNKDKDILKMDLNKVPPKALIKKLMKKIKKRYPNIYKTIIEERNYYMARKLKTLMGKNPDKKILAVVGAGHEDDILSILNENDGITYSFTINNNI